MPNPIVHWEYNTPEAEKVQQFVKDLFGWTINPVPMEPGYTYGLVLTNAGRGADGAIHYQAQAPRGVSIYVEVDDPQAYLDKAVQLGGSIVMPVTVIPNMVTFAILSDPQGNMWGVVKSEEQR
ncbi:MAG: VOC family protein [Chloroflexi bacterium]|nr:VOC family protein [Chloroflexota bacterium]